MSARHLTAISSILPDDASRRAFENALLRRGLMPDEDAARFTPEFSNAPSTPIPYPKPSLV